MPDLVIHDVLRDWLVLIEAVTSHGPVNPKRREELRDLFSASSAGLVFVTAFENRRTLAKYVADISWETEVWVAEDPTHSSTSTESGPRPVPGLTPLQAASEISGE